MSFDKAGLLVVFLLSSKFLGCIIVGSYGRRTCKQHLVMSVVAILPLRSVKTVASLRVCLWNSVTSHRLSSLTVISEDAQKSYYFLFCRCLVWTMSGVFWCAFLFLCHFFHEVFRFVVLA